MRDIVCYGAPGPLGISDDAICSKVHGIPQRAIESEFGDLSEESYQSLNYFIPKKIKFVLELSHQGSIYTITRYSHSELKTIPRICNIENSKGT